MSYFETCSHCGEFLAAANHDSERCWTRYRESQNMVDMSLDDIDRRAAAITDPWLSPSIEEELIECRALNRPRGWWSYDEILADGDRMS